MIMVLSSVLLNVRGGGVRKETRTNLPRKVHELILEDRTGDFLTPSGWFDETCDDS